MALICGAPRITPVDGTQAGCLGGMDGKIQTLTQQVPLPEGAKSVKPSGQICIATAETMQVDHDILTFDLLDGATTILPSASPPTSRASPTASSRRSSSRPR